MWAKFLLIWLALTLTLTEQTLQKQCLKKKLSSDADSDVCVCNSQHCDTTDIPLPSGKNEYVLVTSSKNGDRFNFTVGQFPRRNRIGRVAAPFDFTKTYVKIKNIVSGRQFQGWGGTYTGSTAYVISLMGKTLQQHVFESFYSPNNGSNFSIVRVPIGYTANDFERWTYNDYPVNDKDLVNFTMNNREEHLRNCQIKQLKVKNPDIQLMAVASTAPEWMIHTVKGLHGTRNVLKKEFYDTWAQYHLKYLQMMKDQNMSVSYISTGQRPDTAIDSQRFHPLSWDPYEHGKWLALNLCPTLRASNFRNISIIGYDDNRHKIPLYISSMNLGNANATKCIDAIGIQNYKNQVFLSSILDFTYSTFPSIPIMNTEISFSYPMSGQWMNAETLTIDIIDNLRHDSTAYLYNNLVLNQSGGPNLNGYQQDAPILVSIDYMEFYKQPIFYALAHFSKFITPGSVLLDTYITSADVFGVSYLRRDDRIVVVMYNRLQRTVPLILTDLYQGTAEILLEPKSINTLIY